MDEEKQETCPNCKREIPSVNFQIHVVHCERNIRMCPVCKEPMPQADLEKHHEILHKPQPCKQCGESVCGTDLEDHIRDSCANTVKSCRFCELELPRREIPAHESYCGVRTEQCPDCQEWVMIKYKQLHLDSNHGFIRLDDDPAPPAKFQPLQVNPVIPVNRNGYIRPVPPVRAPSRSNYGNRPGPSKPRAGNKKALQVVQDNAVSSASTSKDEHGISGLDENNPARVVPSTSGIIKENIANPVGNTSAYKKRPAPKPPLRTPPADPRRDLAFYSALQRQQSEERQRAELNAWNLARGLPPVQNPAQKLEKLRKMDALLNPQREVVENPRYTARNPGMPTDEYLESVRRYTNFTPMTQEEFRNRFEDLQLRGRDEGQRNRDGARWTGARAGPTYRRNTDDRFNEIKSSLRELRRGLNEVTAPYNANSNVVPVINRKNGARREASTSASPEASDASDVDMDANPVPRDLPIGTRMSTNALARTASNASAGTRPSNVRVRTRSANMGGERTRSKVTGGERTRSNVTGGERTRSNGTGGERTRSNVTGGETTRSNGTGGERTRSNVTGGERRLPSPLEHSPLAAWFDTFPPDEPNAASSDVEMDVQLPCEFCNQLLPATDLVQHQTGCRPDLTQYRLRAATPPSPPRPLYDDPDDDTPLIPCEFCTQSFPVYVINNHQQNCSRREAN